MRSLSKILAILTPFSLACESVDVGRPKEDPGPPKLVKIMILDATNGRFSDILNTAVEPACSEIDPCDPQPWVHCVEKDPKVDADADGYADGTCVDASNPTHTPPPIGDPGTNTIRMVFSERLDVAIAQKFDTDPDGTDADDAKDILSLTGPNGEVAIDRYYDGSGSPTLTTDPLGEPFGPALVMVVGESLLAGGNYTLTLAPAKITDPSGAVIAEYVEAGESKPIKTTFDFTAEPLGLLAVSPDITATTTEVMQNDVIQFQLSAPVDLAATKAGTNITVQGPGGRSVPVLAWLDFGTDPADCEGGLNPRWLNIVRTTTTAPTASADWATGDHTISVKIVAEGSTSAVEESLSFVVAAGHGAPEEDPSAVENFVLPAQCE